MSGAAGGGAGALEGATPAISQGVGVKQSIRREVVAGAKWATFSKLGAQGMQFLVGLALARLLTPADFGLFASIMVITSFTALFLEMGMGAALVHRDHPSERDMSTVFWINALTGIVYAAVMWALAPVFAAFFDSPRLEGLMPLVAFSFTLTLGVVHNSILQRQLRFKALAVAEMGSTAIGFATSLIAALLGLGALSLVLGPLVTAGLRSVILFVVVRWRPHHFIDRASLRSLWRFSGGLLGFNAVNYWGRNADNLLIGRFLGAVPLAFYARAYNLMLLPVTQITGSLGRVMFPALAAMKDDHARVRSAYLRTLGVINFLTIPALVGLAATSDALVPFLWGEQWTSVTPLLQVLALGGIPQCIATSVGWLYQSQGRTTTMFTMGVISSVVGVAFMAGGLHWGAIGVAWAVLIKSWLMAPVVLHVAGRIVGLRLSVTLKNAASTLISSAVMGLLVWGVPRLLPVDTSSAWILLPQIVLGAAVFLIGARLLEPRRLDDVLSLVSSKRGKRG